MAADLHEITLTTLAYGGEALGRLRDGRTAFVPFGLPGERVRIRLTEERAGFVRGQLAEVLQPAPERIAPKCKHFGVCGGCHYQHMPYGMQLKAKEDILRDQLQRIGKIGDPPVKPTMALPDPWHYRNHVQFHLTREGKIGYVGVGANPRNIPAVIPITECYLPEESINALWPQLEFEPDSTIKRVSLRAGTDGESLLILESDSPEAPEVEIEAAISAVHVFEDDSLIIAGVDYVTMRVLGRDFHVSASSFFQVNTAMAGQMVRHLMANLSTTEMANPDATILDVYCGAGLFSAFLAPTCKRLIGVESSSSACEDFSINLDEFNNVELYEDLAENVLPALTVKPDILVLDPPRAGVERAALDAIVRLEPGVLAYVSCDPSTLARDARRLINGGYHLMDVTPFDLFPQTYHIESISMFRK